jgi:hypothetical protein
MVKATKNGPVALCRCSKSASFPMCSGGCSKGCSKGCGDKVGPLVITSKSPAAAAVAKKIRTTSEPSSSPPANPRIPHQQALKQFLQEMEISDQEALAMNQMLVDELMS